MTSTRRSIAALLVTVAALAGCSATSSTGRNGLPAATGSASHAEPPAVTNAAVAQAAKGTGRACETNAMYPCPKMPAAESGKPRPKPPTVAQAQAVESAQSYVDMSGFSRVGLIEQLTSSAGEGFKKTDAVYAVNHIDVDWNAEAVESAKSYLELSGFSRAGLIEQLSSKAGEGFTLKQAKYAVNQVGL